MKPPINIFLSMSLQEKISSLMNIIEEMRCNQDGQLINKMDNNTLLSLSSLDLYCATYNNFFVDVYCLYMWIGLYLDSVMSLLIIFCLCLLFNMNSEAMNKK